MSRPAPRATQRERLWTEVEFLALPETQSRMELLDGELVREPSAGFTHQDLLKRLVRKLDDWALARTPSPTICQSPLDVRFAPGRILQPDAFVYLEPLGRPVQMPIETIPDLCIEVVSTSRVYDRVTKRAVYAAAGVKEYWTMLLSLRLAERWSGPALDERQECRTRLTTPLLPGFVLDVESLMREH